MPRNKDPDKPKGRSSAYAFFVAEKRKEKKQANEEVQFVKFSQECSALWKDMDTDDKQPYVDLAEKDRVRYEKEMALYVPRVEKESGKRKKKPKKPKDPNKPKRGK